MTRMVKMLRQMPPTKHASLGEIYGIHTLVPDLPTHLLAPSTCHDLPQITTTIAARQIQFISKFVQNNPLHPLTLLLSRNRRPSKHNTLVETIARNLGASDPHTPVAELLPRNEDAKIFWALRAQIVEEEVLNKNHRRYVSGKVRVLLHALIQKNVGRLRPEAGDEDALYRYPLSTDSFPHLSRADRSSKWSSGSWPWRFAICVDNHLSPFLSPKESFEEFQALPGSTPKDSLENTFSGNMFFFS